MNIKEKILNKIKEEKAERELQKQAEIGTYSKQICAFIDILGFSKLIEELNTEDGPNVERVHDFISTFKALKEHSRLHNKYSEGRMTSFSDCIVFSAPLDMPGTVGLFISDILHFQIEMLGFGYLVRGAVEIGYLSHTEQWVFGPALVEAYQKESKVVLNPRIVVSEEAYQEALRNPLHGVMDDGDEQKFLDGFLRCDDDNMRFIDYLIASHTELDEPEYHPIILNKARSLAESMCIDSRSNVRDKGAWLCRYYNLACLQFPYYGLSEIESLI